MPRHPHQATTLPSRAPSVVSAAAHVAGPGRRHAGHHSLRRHSPASSAGYQHQRSGRCRPTSPNPAPVAATTAALGMAPEHHLLQTALRVRLVRVTLGDPPAAPCVRHVATSGCQSPAEQRHGHWDYATQCRHQRHRPWAPHSMRRCRVRHALILVVGRSNSGACRCLPQARGACGLPVAAPRRGPSAEG